jgi:hypothetical protein
MSSTSQSSRVTTLRVEDKYLGWARFEGPGKLHAHRWHRVRQTPLGSYVTLCGYSVGAAQIYKAQGDGLECQTCRQRWLNVRGGHY